MTHRILIMGLPGAGKTTLARALQRKLNAMWFNADDIRKQYNDWDFSLKGRIRQSSRMRNLADESGAKYVLVDFVCPLPEMREIFDAHTTVWVDTIIEGRFEDTNRMFVPPDRWDFRVTEQNAEHWTNLILSQINNTNSLNSCGGLHGNNTTAIRTNTSW